MELRLPSASAGGVTVHSPIDAQPLAEVHAASVADMAASLQALQQVRPAWSALPPLRRGQLLRAFADRLRQHRQPLARLVTLETGKVAAEALGEVQDMIDICDFGAGLSHQLQGLADDLVIASERPAHEMRESWHPFGICGVLSAFDAPVAVWARNAVLALVCGNGLIWKPSEKAPLCALAAHGLLQTTLAAAEPDFIEIAQLCLGGQEQGAWLVEHPALRLISAAGSSAMGRVVGARCAAQFKRTMLELSGNDAAIVRPSANLELAAHAIVSAAVGTSGQRCTTLRRAFIHADVYEQLVGRLKTAYAGLRIGHPAEAGVQMGPLIDAAAYAAMAGALAASAQRGSRVSGGGRLMAELLPQAFYVRPALVETESQHDTMLAETCAPILYLQRVDDLDEAIALTNAAVHGRSSCIFTESRYEAERFMSQSGSDCDIVNVNAGTSGAGIAGTFGGENDIGSGRQARSDAWKAYMRRITNKVNFGAGLPLAQGDRLTA